METVEVETVDGLPLILTMRDVQKITRLSKPKVYELPHIAGFPVVKFGRAFRVPRDAFLEWLEQQATKGEGNE